MTIASDAPSRRRRRKLTGWRAFLRDVAVILVAAILISFLIKTFLVRSFYIPSESMETTLLKNDHIIVNELVPDAVPLQRGDVVVFTDPCGRLHTSTTAPAVNPVVWALSFVGLTSPDSGDHLIKRVIGLPGDHVKCCNALGQLSVNGVPLKEPYVNLGQHSEASTPFDVTVPKNSLWVMGDNRYDSEDSRFHQDLSTKGFVPYSDLVGRAVLITWPISRWSWLDDYPQTFAGTWRSG